MMKFWFGMTFCLLGIIFAPFAEASTDQYQFVNHGYLLNVHWKNSNLSRDFLTPYQKDLVKINTKMVETVKRHCAGTWRFQGESNVDKSELMLNNTINMAIVITRAGVDQEVFNVSKSIGTISYNTFNIGLSLVFFKLTDQADQTGVQLYYTRFITGAKVVKAPKRLTTSQRQQYFIDALFEGTKLLLERAVDEYHPEQIKGRIIRRNGPKMVTDLGRKKGLRANELVQLDINNQAIDFMVSDVKPDQSTIVLFDASNSEIVKNIPVKAPIYALVNSAKRFSNSYEVFQVKKFKIKPKEFDNDREDLLQIFHDYLVKTQKINIMPSETTLSGDVKDTLRKRFNIGYSEFNAPLPDYYINAVLQKIKVTSKKGNINEIRNIFAYGAAGVLARNQPGKLVCQKASNGLNTVQIVQGQTYVEREKKYDTVQICLNHLARDLANEIPAKIKLTY